MSKSITVTSNDPKNPTTTIRVKVFIEVVFDFEQPSLYLGKVSRDASTTKSSFILVKDLPATKVLEVNSSSEFINARMLDYTDNNGHYDRMKLEVTTLPGLPLGRINETVTLKTNLSDKPTAALRLTGSVIGDVEVSPEWMTFVVTDTASSRPSTLTKKIFISSHVVGAELKIVDIKDTEDHLELTLKPLSPGKKYELTATLKPESIPEKGNISGNVVLTTNFPSQKEVAIRYSAVRKSYNNKGGKKNTSGKKMTPPIGSGLRDGKPVLKGGTGEGLFTSSENDPFAPGGELGGAEQPAKTKKMPGSQKKDEPPADSDTDGDSDEEEREKPPKH